MKKCVLITLIFLALLVIISVVVIVQNSKQTPKILLIDNSTTNLEKRLEQKKKEIKEKTVDVNSTTPRKAEQIVFTGVPKIKILIDNGSQGTPEKLSQDKSIEYKCIIIKEDNKYYWKTRENVELIPTQSGIYTTFIATTGAGYVRIIDPEMKKKIFKEGGQPYDYLEHLLLGLSTISYYGTSR